MVYLKWFALCLFDWLMHLTLLGGPPIIAVFTNEMPYGLCPYTWDGCGELGITRPG